MDRVESDNFRLPAGAPDGKRMPAVPPGQRTRTHMHKAFHEALSATEPTHA
jgi:hypothetical protein